MTISLTSFPGIPDSVAAARRFVTGMLRLCPQTSAPDEVVHRVELIVSELCTNAIRHTRSGDPGQKFHVHVCTDERGVHVEVRTCPRAARAPCPVSSRQRIRSPSMAEACFSSTSGQRSGEHSPHGKTASTFSWLGSHPIDPGL